MCVNTGWKKTVSLHSNEHNQTAETIKREQHDCIWSHKGITVATLCCVARYVTVILQYICSETLNNLCNMNTYTERTKAVPWHIVKYVRLCAHTKTQEHIALSVFAQPLCLQWQWHRVKLGAVHLFAEDSSLRLTCSQSHRHGSER